MGIFPDLLSIKMKGCTALRDSRQSYHGSLFDISHSVQMNPKAAHRSQWERWGVDGSKTESVAEIPSVRGQRDVSTSVRGL